MSQTKAQLVQPVGVFTGTGINVTGVITATSFVGSGEGLTGVASTDNIITGTAATFNNTVQVNSTLTANSGFTTNATNTNLKVTGVGTFAGAVTAASFSGDGSGLTGVANTGFINAEQLTVVGVVTAATGNIGNLNITKSAAGAGATVGSFTGVTTYYGDGQYLSGVGLSIAPWNYNPDVNDVAISVSTGIGLTFNTKVLAGSGTATLKVVNAGAAGTTIQSWGISSTTLGVTDITFGALVSDLTKGNTYQFAIPEGFLVDSGGKNYAGTAYTFTPPDYVPPGTIWAWGYNEAGQLGQNQGTTNYSSPVQIPGIAWDNIADSSYYSAHCAGVKNDGTLWVWGKNNDGQLGQSNTTQRSSPVQVPGTQWKYCATGAALTAATRSDGTLWTWGNNTNGELGLGNKTQYSSPKQVGSGTDWGINARGKLSAGAYHIVAVKTDGTLWAWGANGSGGLGQSNTTEYSSPKQIPGTQWNIGAADIEKSMSIKTNGQMWAWGKNQHGQLGIDWGTNYCSSPRQVAGTWDCANFGDDMGMGIKSDGTLWAYGVNTNGQMGQNTTTPGISSPIQVGSATDWMKDNDSAVSCSGNTMIALKADGTIWAWGLNNYGALGQNNTVKYSSPVQLPGDKAWTQVESMAQGTLACDSLTD